MKLLIVSHVLHKRSGADIGGYSPYVREMNLWLKHAADVVVLAPIKSGHLEDIDLAYEPSGSLSFVSVPEFNVTDVKNAVRTLFILPVVLLRLYSAMRWADHIHIRCPGNMGLVACFVQMLFPAKAKSAKYAANWDRTAEKAWSYRLQQRIIGSPMLARKMQVMVYGEWPNKTENLRSFFTATYHAREIVDVRPRSLGDIIQLVFVGRLVKGKRPLVAAAAVDRLLALGYSVRLDFYGDGPEGPVLEQFIEKHGLQTRVALHGSLSKDALKSVYQRANFLIFPTVMSEGWPKVVAEAMFWGCVPITTNVSCVPFLLGDGSRGAIVSPDVDGVVSAVLSYAAEPHRYAAAARDGMNWSRQFTLERFELEIVQLLRSGAKDG